jgi:hypothetical protein
MAEDLEFLKGLMMIAPTVEEPIEYRLHYNDIGEITTCTMRQHPENTQYLIVTKIEYDNYFRYVVVDNKLNKIDMNSGNRVQLKSSTQGYCVVKNHAGIILENEEYQDVEYYESN